MKIWYYTSSEHILRKLDTEVLGKDKMENGMRNGRSSNKAHNILFGRGDDREGPRTRHAEKDRCPEFIVILNFRSALILRHVPRGWNCV